MDLSERFHNFLQSSTDGFIWAVEQVPPERRYRGPPGPLGEWSAARHVFHMFYYDQTIALPSMRQWFGEACPPYDEESEDAAWDEETDLETLLGQFAAIRAEQVALLSRFDAQAWEEQREALWGPVTYVGS